MRCAGDSTVAAWAIGGGVSSVYRQKHHIHHLHHHHNHHRRHHHHHYHHHRNHHHYHHRHVYHHLCLKQLEVCLSLSGNVLNFVASKFISTLHMRKKRKSGHSVHH